MASKSKKLRIRYRNDHFEIEKEDNGKQKLDFLPSMISLCSSNYLLQTTLTPVKILNCNAAASVPSSFSKVFCDIEYYGKDSFVFGDAFRTGMDILGDYFIRNIVPKNRQFQSVFEKLLDFIDGDRSVKISDPHRVQNLRDKELAIILSNHLFGKLALTSYFAVDKAWNCEDDGQCFCDDENCEMTGGYVDTSIGNVEVWHGCMDIVINNDMPVVVPWEAFSDSSNGNNGGEMKEESVLEGCAQLIAETIVFSFLKRKSQPDRNHFLTPCIGISNSEMVVVLYDAKNDVLLESSPIPLFKDSFSGEFSYTAVLVSWLTVNYKYLCTTVPEHFTNDKSEFFVHAKNKLPTYQGNLRFGGVLKNQATNLPRGKLKRHKANSSTSMVEHEKKLMEILWRP